MNRRTFKVGTRICMEHATSVIRKIVFFLLPIFRFILPFADGTKTRDKRSQNPKSNPRFPLSPEIEKEIQPGVRRMFAVVQTSADYAFRCTVPYCKIAFYQPCRDL